MLQGTTQLLKKGPSKASKKIFFLFPATLPDRLHTSTNFNNKNFQQTYNGDILSSTQGRWNEGRAKGGNADGKGNFGLMNYIYKWSTCFYTLCGLYNRVLNILLSLKLRTKRFLT